MFNTKKSIFALTITACFIASSVFANNAFAQVADGQDPHHFPPMLGDIQPYTFKNGFVLNDQSYNVTSHTINVGKSLEVGKQATINLNIYDVRQSSEISHVGIFIAPIGNTVPTSSMPYIMWDSSVGVITNTGNGKFSGMTGGVGVIDVNHATTTFHFTPLKSVGESNIIVRMWDKRSVSNDNIFTGITIGSANGSTGNENPCNLIVMKKGWKMTPACLAYLLS